MLPKPPDALRPVLDVGGRIARQAPSTAAALAQLHGILPPEVVPPEVREDVMAELRAAHERAATPLRARDVEGVLKDAWGARPSSVLDDLDLGEPVAVTAASQVHRAELDGTPVAVKVRRPGLAEGIRRDLQLLDALAGPLGAAFPRLDPRALLREVRERVLDELDLEDEGSNQRRVCRAVRRDPDLVVPAVHSEHTTEAVLVSDWIDGTPLSEALPDDRSRTARALVRLHLGAPSSVGLVLADPRPADVLVLRDGRVALLDLAAAPADRERLGPALDVLQALREGDEQSFGTAVRALGAAADEDAATAFRLAREIAGDVLDGPVRGDHALLGRLAAAALARADEGFGLALRSTPHPADLWAGRMLGQLAATIGVLGATEDWTALALAAGRGGIEAGT